MNLGFCMKKLFIFPLLISVLFFSVITACSFEDEDDSISAPSVDYSSTSTKGVTVVRERLNSSTESVLVYRINVSDAPSKEVHIGTLYPAHISESLLIFNDPLVYSSKTYKYRYVFVDTNSTKFYTNWSREIKVTNGQSTTIDLKYKIDPATQYLAYDQTEYTLKAAAALDPLDDTSFDWLKNYIPSIILRTSGDQLSFRIKDNQFDGTESISLKEIIPRHFYDTPIYCGGIVGRYAVDNSDGQIERIYWTEPSEITVKKGSQDITARGFTIPSNSSDGGISY